jgi:hypothetical protein
MIVPIYCPSLLAKVPEAFGTGEAIPSSSTVISPLSMQQALTFGSEISPIGLPTYK